MPTYQYQCTECDEALEVQQSFTDDALTVCPVCEGRLRKVYNAVGVVFKGSGFYRTDSRTDKGAGKDSGGSSTTPTAPAKSKESSSSGSSATTSTPAGSAAAS